MTFKIIDTPPFNLTILYENAPWKKLNKSLFKKELKGFSFEGDLKEVEKKFFELECKIARNYALIALSKRAMFTNVLKKKLEEKGISEKAVEFAIDFCLKLGALKDSALAESFIQKRMSKGYSASFAKRSLKLKAHLSFESSPHIDEKRLILQTFKKRFASADLADIKIKQKVYSFFLRRGFSSEQILDCIKDLAIE